MTALSKGIVELRRATLEDADRLLAWRNDPLAVAMSKSGKHVEHEEHLVWLRKAVAEDWMRIFVAVVPGTGHIGFIRLKLEVSESLHIERIIGTVSIAVAAEHRGKGLGWQMLDLALGEAARVRCVEVRADIHRHNIVSRRMFASRCFTLTSNPLGEWLEYRRTL